ncbi:YhdP family protein [Shewanella maritima]|uniref:YhdP family protein n=1 Tax=Shewanella maritima TaxID=2520507 RepID=UPI003735DB04
MAKSQAKKVGRICWQFFAIALVLFALVVSLIRGLLPHVPEIRQEIVNYIESQYQIKVQVTELSAQWQAYGPELSAHHLVIPQQDKLPLTIVAQDVHVKLDFWESLLSLTPQIETVVFDGLSVALDLDALKAMPTTGNASRDLDWLYALLLEQLEHYSINDASFLIYSKNHQFRPIYIDSLHWLNTNNRHRGKGLIHLDLDASAKERLAVNVDLTGNGYRPDSIAGDIYIVAKSLDIGEWASRREDPIIDLNIIEFEGVINLEAWMSVANRGIQDAIFDFQPSWLKWEEKVREHRLDMLSGQLLWQPTDHGWQFSSQALDFITNGNPWDLLQLQMSKNNDEFHARISELSFANFTPLLPLIPGVWRDEVETWHAIDPQGFVGPIEVNKREDKSWVASVTVNDMQWQPYAGVPGIEPIDFNLHWQDNRLIFELPKQQYALDFADGFRESLQFDSNAIEGSFDTNNMELVIPQVQFGNTDIAFDAGVKLTFNNNTHMALAANMQIHDVAKAEKYFPLKSMSEGLVSYLKMGLVAGQIPEAQVVWHGNLNQYPYDDASGIFQADFSIKQGQFQFQDDWPMVTELDLYALFENAGMDLLIRSGNLGEVPVDGAKVAIARFEPELVLTVVGDINPDAHAAYDVIKQSPLAESVGSVLDVVQIEQQLNLLLDLSFALYDDGPAPQINGFVKFDGNPVFIAEPGMQLRDVRGDVSFASEIVQGHDIEALLFGQPLQFTFNTEKKNQNMALNVDIDGQWQLDALPASFANPLSDYYQGQMDWQGDLLMIFDPSGYTLQVHTQSDLQGTELNLPAPFAKTAEQPMQLRAELVGDNLQSSLSIKLDNKAEFWGEFNQESGNNLAYYDLLIGRRFQLGDELRKSDGHLNIDLPYAEFTQWLPIINQFTSQTEVISAAIKTVDEAEELQPNQTANANEAVEVTDGAALQTPLVNEPLVSAGDTQEAQILSSEVVETVLSEASGSDSSLAQSDQSETSLADSADDISQTAFFPALTQISGKLEQLELMGQTFNQVEFVAQPLEYVWRFDIDSQELVGHIDIYGSWRDQGLKIVAQKLHLSPEFKSSDSADYTQSELLGNMPPLAIDVDDFAVYDINFGHLVMQADPVTDGYHFSTVSLERPLVTISAVGDWQMIEGQSMSKFDVEMNSTKFDELSDMLGINLGIKDAPLGLVGEFSWQGAPYDFSLETLNGELKFDVGKGHLSEISDKGARIFSLFSLDSLVRKLSLDFSDVFGQGLYFNSFNGSLDIDNGVVKTTDSEMDAIAGNMRMRGFTDLTTGSLNYDIRFVPQLASSVPTVVLLSTSAWTLGVGAFALTKVLEPVIEVISEIRFRVTGDIDTPILEELERKSKEIEIPESVLREAKPEQTQEAEQIQQPEQSQDPEQSKELEQSKESEQGLGASPATNDQASDSLPTVEQTSPTNATEDEEPTVEPQPNVKQSDPVTLANVTMLNQATDRHIKGRLFIDKGQVSFDTGHILIDKGECNAMELTAMSKQQRCTSQSSVYRIAA